MFIKEQDFKAFSKGKKVVDYPNQYVKDVAGERVDIIPTGECITFKKMSESDVRYYIGNVGEDVYEASVKIGCWFPTELVCGVVRGCFSQNTDLSKDTGWLQTTGQFGSKNDAFLVRKAKVAAKKLKDAGFKVVFA